MPPKTYFNLPLYQIYNKSFYLQWMFERRYQQGKFKANSTFDLGEVEWSNDYGSQLQKKYE